MVRIGIDLSINSTGLVIEHNDGTFEYYIITSKTTKKLTNWNDPRVNVILYEKKDIPKDASYSEKEAIKSKNLIQIVNIIRDIVYRFAGDAVAYIEGMSYGSTRTTALADLSGLNYMVRYILNNLSIPFVIVSPMENKKLACGIGNADKDVMIGSWLKCQPDMKGIEKLIKADDIADAYFLSQIKK